VACGIGKDGCPVTVRLAFRLGCTKSQKHRFGLVEVINREVEVRLLRGALAWPVRCPVAFGPLKADEESVLTGQAAKSSSDCECSLRPVVCW
jgi:hypothetical protein